jgi:carnosine N-methyltransferase
MVTLISRLRSYRRAAHYNITHIRRQSFYALPQAHWTSLAKPPFNILNTLSAVDDAIDANAEIAEAIALSAVQSFVSPSVFEREIAIGNTQIDHVPPWKGKASSTDLDKARSTIRQFYRDWSAEGAAEREACYQPVIKALAEEYQSIAAAQRHQVRVLVPGAGLGRLVFELCAEGYTVEGNEISYHQLMASSYILNHSKAGEQLPLYPWALSFSNHTRRQHQLRRVMIPDVHPGTALNAASEGKEVHAFERMSMSAADFCVLYSEIDQQGKYDVVATVFFIDTAPNLIRYIEAIRNTLKIGGIWVNLGPLLWHFENNPPGQNSRKQKEGSGNDPSLNSADTSNQGIGEVGSVEFTDEEVTQLLEYMGFKIESHSTGEITTGYVQDPESMLSNVYRPSFWIARRVQDSSNAG